MNNSYVNDSLSTIRDKMKRQIVFDSYRGESSGIVVSILHAAAQK